MDGDQDFSYISVVPEARCEARWTALECQLKRPSIGSDTKTNFRPLRGTKDGPNLPEINLPSVFFGKDLVPN